MTSLDSPELLRQLEDALEAAGDLRRRADQITDALITLAAKSEALTQREIAELVGASSPSFVSYRLSRDERSDTPGRGGAAQTHQQDTQAPNLVQTVQSALRELLSAQEVAVASRDDAPALGGGQRIGWTENGTLWLHPRTTLAQLEQHNADPGCTVHGLGAALAATDTLARTRATHQGARSTVSIRLPGAGTVDVWELPLTWLTDQSE